MPNPFPGMDPYLEGSLWSPVQSNLMEEIARQLAPQLRPKYLALSNRRIHLPDRQPQTYLEIRDVAEHRLVTALEVLSPTNKRGDGMAEFSRKRREMLAGSAHYVEIDLLRVGQRFPVVGALPSVPYFVFLSRVLLRPRLEVWPIALDQPLPTIPIPLLAGDADVHLGLQHALTTVYDLFGYDTAANHRSEPAVPQLPEWSDWVQSRLQAAGIQR